MATVLLGPMLRYVDETSATLWMETDGPGHVRVLDTDTPTFAVDGHHYALVILEGLEPGSTIEYQVHVDGEQAWPPPDSSLPPSVIRTLDPDGEHASVLFGSCRAAAPHEPPFDLELSMDHEARGVDALWAHAHRMLEQPPDEWPTLLVLAGDQIYADDSSPGARERIEQVRGDGDLPPEIAATFEEYTWLYREAWSAPIERWLFSVLPSMMIFDDHDMIDDWNISASWVRDIRAEPWWREHAVAGLVSYWVYQHLGNQSPTEIRADGLLADILADGDGTATLRKWAQQSEEFTPVPGGYRFSFQRRVARTTVVVIDCRNGRVLTPGARAMVDDAEWGAIADVCRAVHGHLMVVTSLPVFVADGIHDLQVWNERVCDGAWGRRAADMGEKARRSLDLEDWSAFSTSYRHFTALMDELAVSGRLHSITVVSGDIHFSYVARVPHASGVGGHTPVHQVVSSPIRNALIPPERGVIRFMLTRAGAMVGRMLRRLSGATPSAAHMELLAGPFFANNLGELRYTGADASVRIEHATATDDVERELRTVTHVQLT